MLRIIQKQNYKKCRDQIRQVSIMLSWAALTGQSVEQGINSNFAFTATSTGFSVFGAGSDDGDPLPVELCSFTGIVQMVLLM